MASKVLRIGCLNGILLLVLIYPCKGNELKCKFRVHNGEPTYQLSPSPGPHCEPHWSTTDGDVLANGQGINQSLVSAVSIDRISLKNCLELLSVSLDCENQDSGLVNFKVECSGNCSTGGIQPATDTGNCSTGGIQPATDTAQPRHRWTLVPIACLWCLFLVVILYKRFK